MYFKKLEITGFKSFAKRTVLHFEPGITAVVGPNGCGKSNIFDAIRWVLGEQSIKALRGSQMEDVIFNGTEVEAQLGFAEASLSFDNTNKNLPIEYDEVVVTRRLYRSGESEYLLNKQTVRLKDILNIFMGTGVGAESYSLIAQGKIDLIVSIKPEERRFIIDEAAGITRFKSKKKETLKKLEDTENNLLRLNDIISEVKRQISSIERQANKARRYKEQFQKLKDLEMQAAFFQLNNLDKDIDIKTKDIKSLEEKEQRLKEEISFKLSDIKRIKEELDSLQDKLQEERDDFSRAKNLQEINNQNIKLNLERIEEYSKFIDNLELKKKDLDKRISSEEENISILDSELSSLEAKIRETNAELIKREECLGKNNSLVKTLQNSITQAKKEIFEKTTDLTKSKNDLTDFSGQIISWQARKRRLDLEVVKIREERSGIENEFIRAQEEFAKEEMIILNIKKEIDNLKIDISANKNELDKLNQEIADLESELLTLESQRQFLQDLKLRYDNLPEVCKATIFIDSEAALKNSLNCGIIGRLLEEKEINSKDQSLTGFAAEIKPIDLDAKNITKRIEELRQKITEVRSKKEIIDKQVVLQGQGFLDKEKELHQKDISFSNISIKKTDLEAQLVRFDEEASLVETELEEARNSLSELDKTTDELKSNIVAVETHTRDLEDTINTNQQEIAKCNNVREKEMTELARLRAETSALKDANNNQVQTRNFLEETKESHILDRESTLNQIRDLREKQNNTQENNTHLQAQNIELNNRLSALDKELQSQQAIFQDKSSLLEDLENQGMTVNKSLEDCGSEVFNLKLSMQDIEFKKKSILDRLHQLYQIQELDIKSYRDLSQEEIADTQELQNEIDLLRKKIDSYGNVNLVADEEYEDLKKRFEFLTAQSNDLLQAKESLLKAIRKINQTSKKLFIETFAGVNEEFKNYFRLLFGGGQGHLFLIDEQDPLESGIEIVCRPPGKKLQNISLLSGGEKSLTAIALLFAIFKVKPAPFCVLDEVDSALDESNIDRFRVILEEFAKSSQFIIITHNKKTISSSDTMYGITMEDTGISKIVSVRFAKEDEKENKEDKELEPARVN